MELFNRATGIRARFGVSYWDAAILAAAKLLGCDAVYSEDLDREAAPAHTLTVRASDGAGGVATTTVTVSVAGSR